MAVDLSSLPSRTIFFDDSMVLKLGAIERNLRHILALHAVAYTQVPEVVEDMSQHLDVFLQVRAEIMRMPPQVVCQASPGSIGQVTLDASFLQSLCHRHFGNVGPKKTAGGKIHRDSSLQLSQRIAIVRRKVAIRVKQPRCPHPERLASRDSRTVEP